MSVHQLDQSENNILSWNIRVASTIIEGINKYKAVSKELIL